MLQFCEFPIRTSLGQNLANLESPSPRADMAGDFLFTVPSTHPVISQPGLSPWTRAGPHACPDPRQRAEALWTPPLFKPDYALQFANGQLLGLAHFDSLLLSQDLKPKAAVPFLEFDPRAKISCFRVLGPDWPPPPLLMDRAALAQRANLLSHSFAVARVNC